MKHIRILLILILLGILLTIPVLSGCSTVREYSDPMTENILTALNNEDYSNFSKDFDDSMKQEITEENFGDFIAAVDEQFGDYKAGSKKFLGFNYSNGVNTVEYNAEFTKAGEIKVQVIIKKINDQMKVIGLWFK